MEPEIAEDDPPPLDPGDWTARQLLADPSVAALLVALFLFSSSVFAQSTIVGWQVLQISGRELDLGLVGFAEFAPLALLVVVAGWVADRYDRRWVTGFALVGEAVVMVVSAWYASTDPTAVGPVFALAAAFGLARAFAAPAERSLKPLVAPPGALPRLVALHSTTWNLALVVGPVVGGLLLTVSIAVAYLGCAVLTLAGLVALTFVRYRTRPTPTTDRPSVSAALRGLRAIRRSPVLLGAISLDLMAVLFGGAVALLPAIAEKQLGVGSAGFGLLKAAGGIGAATVAVLLSVRPLTRRVGGRLFVAVGLFGVFTIVLGVARDLWVAVVAVVALMAADMVSVFIRATLVPLVTPDELRGRVTAVENVFIGASNELGAFESGVAAQWLGLTPAVVLGGVATLTVAVVWAWRFPALRGVDRFEDVTPMSPD